MAVELGLTPDTRWDIDVAGLAAAAAGAGFSALGLPGKRADAAGALTAAGLRCHELLAGVPGVARENSGASPQRETAEIMAHTEHLVPDRAPFFPLRPDVPR
jgi:hypothetical protein